MKKTQEEIWAEEDAIEAAEWAERKIWKDKYAAAQAALLPADKYGYVASAALASAWQSVVEGEIEDIAEDNSVFWRIAFGSIGSILSTDEYPAERKLYEAAGLTF